jgi:thiamine-monophosphate kinase
MMARLDEFDWIERLRPLTRGDSRALGLLDDVSIIPGRPGFELVISKDAMVEGVHFMPGEHPAVVAKRLIRTSLSDLAAKAADPFGYFLMIAWPQEGPQVDPDQFIRGLEEDGIEFGVSLLGGDTVTTPGPLTLSATVLGWAPEGGTIRRSGARAGDLILVCGPIGDGWLGLQAVLGGVADPDGRLAAHYRLPRPLFCLQPVLRNHATAAADVSDGLVADAGHICAASELGMTLDLANVPLSEGAVSWLAEQPDRQVGLATLATGGDDYAIVCAVPPQSRAAFCGAVAQYGIPFGVVGVFEELQGVRVRYNGSPVTIGEGGWRH